MTRALLALLLVVLEVMAAADGDVWNQNGPDGVTTSQDETDAGGRFDPNG